MVSVKSQEEGLTTACLLNLVSQHKNVTQNAQGLITGIQ